VLAAAHRAYAYDLVTAEQAARELGLSPAEFAAAMAASDDPVILALVAGLEVQREQWEGSYAQGALLAGSGKGCTTETRRHGDAEARRRAGVIEN
jgi:hypothetical protein